jgi:hypothetical protein
MNAVILDDTTTGRSILYSNVDDRVCSGVTIFDPDIQRVTSKPARVFSCSYMKSVRRDAYVWICITTVGRIPFAKLQTRQRRRYNHEDHQHTIFRYKKGTSTTLKSPLQVEEKSSVSGHAAKSH